MKRNLKGIFIRGNDFILIWITLLKHILRNESKIQFGDKNEPKALRGEICSKVIIEGKNGVDQILNGAETVGQNPKIKFGSGLILRYIYEFTMEYVLEQRSLPDGHPKKFSYGYYERLRFYPMPNGETFDQVAALLKNLKRALASGIFSNRHQMITWIPYIDAFSGEPPCLQRIWITLIDEKSIEIHIDWRSRDAYGAWLANLIAIVNMITRDISDPLGLEIIKIVDRCDSLHVYNGDWNEAKQTVERF